MGAPSIPASASDTDGAAEVVPGIEAIVLAAGKGTRMRSELPKVLHCVAGQPMLGHVLRAAGAAGVSACHVVLGHQAERIEAWLAACGTTALPVDTILQNEQLGTAHAVRIAMPRISDDRLVVVLYGDVPLVDPQLVRAVCDAAAAGLAIVTARPEDPSGYGRVLRDASGAVSGVVEERDASAAQRAIGEVNTGLLAAPAGLLRGWLARVGNANAKGEYYLTDIIALAVADGICVHAVEVAEARSVEGVNDVVQLAAAERFYQSRLARRLLQQGVRLADPARLDVRGELVCGRDVFIDVGCVFEGHVELGDGVSVGPYSVLRDVRVGGRTRIAAQCVLEGSEISTDCTLGPFAHLRPGARLEPGVHVGNFVEIKNSTLATGAKAGHLAYLGDASVGARANISAGVITCNYDGANKHRTVIGADAFIGTDSQLVAPVRIADGAFIAAGSTISHDVTGPGLTICRAREQRSYPGWKRPAKKKT